jgi:hypothetical protein
MLYPRYKVNINFKGEKVWVIQRNIEVEEKWALKKEEPEKEIKENNIRLYELFYFYKKN